MCSLLLFLLFCLKHFIKYLRDAGTRVILCACSTMFFHTSPKLGLADRRTGLYLNQRFDSLRQTVTNALLVTPKSEEKPMKRNTILCVDDDADDLLLLNEILQEYNEDFNVKEAHNGRQAIDILQTAKAEEDLPCLIILDINMPVLNGKQTLTYIREDETFKSIPVVVFTTSGSSADKHFCNMYGAEMITKPPNYNSFKTVVHKLLRFCTVKAE